MLANPTFSCIHPASVAMERAAGLWAEVLLLCNLHEVSSRLCWALPMASSAGGCHGVDRDVRRPKRKYSERRCEEENVGGVNELLLKYGRRSECDEGPSLLGRER